ncbi:uncharacterized protein [Physcomitrium patens]|uniref:uncharacterized protein isoform X1 n=1 Tax=Physcomitrium patens TaxID=3218 RepID=UPI00024AE244|nr:uncharacterized protein LOC112290537 isoform X2 [Physcomitrium patens]|eukprot:XP_024392658.1 uncharacterized protein LOC112290537 isoform X2 [Physcomitrella patens]
MAFSVGVASTTGRHSVQPPCRSTFRSYNKANDEENFNWCLVMQGFGFLQNGATPAIDPKTRFLKCQYSSDVATGYAVGSFMFLRFSQVFIMLASRCLCCGSGVKPGGAKTFGVLMFLLSWMCFVVATSALIAGAAQNKIQTEKYYNYFGDRVTCREVRKSLFEAAAAFTFLTMIFSELYFLLLSKAREPEPWMSNGPSVGMSRYPSVSFACLDFSSSDHAQLVFLRATFILLDVHGES